MNTDDRETTFDQGHDHEPSALPQRLKAVHRSPTPGTGVNSLTNHPRAKIDMVQAARLRYEKGLTLEQIAKQFDSNKSSIHAALKRFERYFGNPQEVKSYGDNDVSVLKAAEWKLVTEVVNPAKLAKASTNNVAYALRQVHDISQIKQGMATEIVDMRLLSEELEDLRKRRQALETILREREINVTPGVGGGMDDVSEP